MNIINAILIQPLYNLLMLLVFIMPGNSLGLAVITLTIIIRLALLSTTKSFTRQQALMAKLKPEMDKIREDNKDDKQAQAQALMAFYKKHHINPAGSCLPMIIQLIILIALYYVFRMGITDDRFDLLYSFIPHPGQVNPHFLGLDLAQPSVWVLPIIAGVLQFLQAYQMLPKNADPNDPSVRIQKQTTFMFPFLTVWIARGFPAALPLYWTVSSIFSIIQQAVILKQTAKITPAQADEILESPDPDKAEDILEKKLSKKGVEVTVRKKSKK